MTCVTCIIQTRQEKIERNLSVMSSLRNIPPSLYIDKSPSTVRVGRLTANYVVGVQGATGEHCHDAQARGVGQFQVDLQPGSRKSVCR